MIYVVDTTLYIEANRNKAFARELRAFLQRASSQIAVSSVVLHELMLGVKSTRQMNQIASSLLVPFHTFHRVLETTAVDWRDAAVIHHRISAQEGYDAILDTPNFRYDMLIAASCRRTDATLITGNRKHSEIIRAANGFRYLAEFPPS